MAGFRWVQAEALIQTQTNFQRNFQRSSPLACPSPQWRSRKRKAATMMDQMAGCTSWGGRAGNFLGWRIWRAAYGRAVLMQHRGASWPQPG